MQMARLAINVTMAITEILLLETEHAIKVVNDIFDWPNSTINGNG
jgi:hypothetical protein